MNATRQNPPGRGEPAQTLTDTHAHLGDAVFDADRAGVLSAAGRAGIGRIIAVAETLADAEKNLVLADRHRAILPAAGLFPTYLDTSEAGRMRAFIRRHAGRLAAVGEVGLDYWKVQDEALREIQREIFCGFIDLAVELDIPLNVHSRSAGRHVIALLLERAAGRVQLAIHFLGRRWLRLVCGFLGKRQCHSPRRLRQPVQFRECPTGNSR